jgi:hypothetical protein
MVASVHAQQSAARTVNAGAAVAVAAVVCQSALYLWSWFVLDRPLYDIGNAARFNSWAGDVSVAACAVAAGLLAVSARPVRLQAAALTPLLAFLAVDEGTEVHETIAAHVIDWLGIDHVGPGLLWPFLYAPLLVVVGYLIMRIAAAAPLQARRLFELGLAALAVAVVAQLAWGAFGDELGYLSDAHIFEIVVEEGGELGGWLLIATGLFAALAGHASGISLDGTAGRRPAQTRTAG